MVNHAGILLLHRVDDFTEADFRRIMEVNVMTKCAALELAEDNIRVKSMHPGDIATPMKRWGQPSEVSAVVLFLASDESSFVPGGDYTVDGGFTSY